MIPVRNRHHPLPTNNRLRQPRAPTRVQHQQRIPLGLLKRLAIRKRLNPLLGEPPLDRKRHHRVHIPLMQPRLHRLLEPLVKPNRMAPRQLKQVQLPLVRVARGNEQRFVPGLDGAEREDEVAHVVGAEEGYGGELVRGEGGAGGRGEFVRDAVDGVGGLRVCEGFPAVLWVGGARDPHPFAVGGEQGALVDDVDDEAAAVGAAGGVWHGGGFLVVVLGGAVGSSSGIRSTTCGSAGWGKRIKEVLVSQSSSPWPSCAAGDVAERCAICTLGEGVWMFCVTIVAC